MSFKISPQARMMMEIRLGRVQALDEHLKQHPEQLNQKFQTATGKTETFAELAVRFNQGNVVFWLIEQGAVLSPQASPQLLFQAVTSHNRVLAEYLTKKGWDPLASLNDPGALFTTPISQAAGIASVEILKMWQSLGVDMKTPDPATKSTLLHSLCHGASCSAGLVRHLACATWLMEQGVNWDAPDHQGALAKNWCEYPDFSEKLDQEWARITSATQKAIINKAIDSQTSTAKPLATAKKF